MLRSHEFTCAQCGFTFPKARTDEDAMAEARENFGGMVDKEPLVMICNDCWKTFMALRNKRLGRN